MSQRPKTNPVDFNAGFNTGLDMLGGVLGAYFDFEEKKQGLELKEAQFQQQRLQDAISVDQQVNEQIADKQGRENGESKGFDAKVLLMGAAGLLLSRFLS